MKENTHPAIKVHNYRIWWGTNIDKNLQSDHIELFHCLESSSSMGSSRWGHISVIVQHIFNFKINTPLN